MLVGLSGQSAHVKMSQMMLVVPLEYLKVRPGTDSADIDACGARLRGHTLAALEPTLASRLVIKGGRASKADHDAVCA